VEPALLPPPSPLSFPSLLLFSLFPCTTKEIEKIGGKDTVAIASSMIRAFSSFPFLFSPFELVSPPLPGQVGRKVVDWCGALPPFFSFSPSLRAVLFFSSSLLFPFDYSIGQKR